MERSLSVKLKARMSNSIYPDETAHYEPSHLDLCCLQKTVITACGSEKLNGIVASYVLMLPFVDDRID